MEVKKRKHVPKSTAVELINRVNEIKEQMLLGYTRYDVVRYGTEKWGVSERQIEDYMSKANAILDEINMLEAKDNLKLLTSNMWKIFRKALEEGDRRHASELLREIGKLRGLYNEKVTMVLDDKRVNPDMSDIELESALDEYAQH